jgi:hypothetical protein
MLVHPREAGCLQGRRAAGASMMLPHELQNNAAGGDLDGVTGRPFGSGLRECHGVAGMRHPAVRSRAAGKVERLIRFSVHPYSASPTLATSRRRTTAGSVAKGPNASQWT